jgi:hypothetical protein
MATRSFDASWSTSIDSDCFTKGSRLGAFMDPDVSMRNTRLALGRVAG